MSTNEFDDLFEDNNQSTSGNDLPKKLRQKIDEQAGQLKELMERLGVYETEKRTANIAETLIAKGLNAKIATLIPKDIDADGLDSWIEQYGEIFAPAGGRPPAVQDSRAGAIQQIAAAEAGASVADAADFYTKLNSANSINDIKLALGSMNL